MTRSEQVPWGPAEIKSLREMVASRPDAWDLVVVGGGITGAGIARDAAIRGLSTLLLEGRDVAFGTSSRSSRLIHGGVRYLEQGEVGLVFEALRERGRLYELAPHLVQPSRFIFPTYEGDRLGLWRLRVGLTMYDALNFFRGAPHRHHGPESALAVEPLLAAPGLLGAVEYEDAVTDDARLTLTVLQDARRFGAEVLTYAEVGSIDGKPGDLTVHLDDGTKIRSHDVIVATGPWTGAKLLGESGEGLLTLSKGIHVVMRREDVPVRRPVVVQAPAQRRILFVVPWGNRTYLGTTDAPYTGDPGRSSVTEADEHELLELIGRLLPGARLEPDRIVSAWSGVRPLVRGDAPKGADTSELSRRHRIVEGRNGALGIVGGKLTTFRAMGEEVVDRVIERRAAAWPEDRRAPGPCRTHEIPLTPGEPLTIEERDDPLLEDLRARHGSTSRIVARAPDHERLADGLPYRWCEVGQSLRFEGVTHVVDLLRRRLPLALTDPALGGGVARRIAERLVDAWGGSGADVEEQLERFREEVELETRRAPKID